MATALDGLHVVRIGDDLASAYCAKLLTDLGAEVVRVEPADGDPLRHHSAAHPGVATDGDGALFSYLHAGTASAPPEHQADLLAWADLLVLGHSTNVHVPSLEAIRAIHPDLPVVTTSPYGSNGPLADIPATEFTVEAWAGFIDARGYADRPPVQQGNRAGELISGAMTALAGLAVVRAGGGDIDVSWMETIASTLNFPTLYRDFTGAPAFTSRGLDYPSVERCKDGLIGLCIFTPQQWNDFAALMGRDDLNGDDRFTSMGARGKNREVVLETIQPWLDDHTAEEIVELCGLFRVPVAFIGNGRDLHSFAHFVERGVFVENPDGGFRQPRPPFALSATPPGEIGHVPAAASAPSTTGGPARARKGATPSHTRPLDGVRILDLTAFWAGPSATHFLRTLGAEVIKVEGRMRPDGMRLATIAPPSRPGLDGEGSDLPRGQPRQALDRRRHVEAGRAGGRAPPGGDLRRRVRELHTPRDGEPRPALRRRPRRQPADRDGAHARVRAGRLVARPGRLRPDDRTALRHGLVVRPTGRDADRAQHVRPDRRHARGDGLRGRPRPPGPHGRGTADRGTDDRGRPADHGRADDHLVGRPPPARAGRQPLAARRAAGALRLRRRRSGRRALAGDLGRRRRPVGRAGGGRRRRSPRAARASTRPGATRGTT